MLWSAAAGWYQSVHTLRVGACPPMMSMCVCVCSVVDRTLATWVKETAYGVSPAWLAAASNLAPGSSSSSPDMAEAQPGTAATPPNWVGKPPQWLLPPLSAEQREMMKGEIAGQWRWSEAAGLLADYHAAHGYGLISMHGVLTWTGSTLAGQDVLKGEQLPAVEGPRAQCRGWPPTQLAACAGGVPLLSVLYGCHDAVRSQWLCRRRQACKPAVWLVFLQGWAP